MTQVTASNLRNRGFIVRNKGYLTREFLDQEAKFGNFTPKIIYTVPTMKLMIDLVRRNVGIALARKVV
ncbi:LysR family transcriptional regulator substrate-binding protein [Lactobacillus sp. ESL0791]|uniref:LysR family transcriptional regulator substrate-binding protein n=1 Tax=Lactobacillus sp. ESL0791 TaxID=2983234 RepID=UPI0023F62AC9|nr:LysR family transcriptional regulator substrate-binding protein [Lactobacillus sp. ESL0791]MDF7639023.1 LysR family transcriptional regulator substrate-binding protein [Lactobacillus sp. ESL0791]